MIWVYGFSICLLLLVADAQSAGPPVTDAGWHICLVALAFLVPPAFAATQALVVRRWRQIESGRRPVERIRRGLGTANFLVWLSAGAAIVTVLRWPSLVRVNGHLGQWPLVDELLVIAPSVFSTLLAWFVLQDAELSVSADPDAGSGAGWWQRLNLIGQRIRACFGLVLAPVLLLFLFRDLADCLFPTAQSGMVTGIGFCILLIGLWFAYPLIAAATWRTAPLGDTDLRQELDQICRARGLRPETIRMWDTGGTLVNAVVVGMVPGFRRIFLTDELLRQFEPREIHAIFRHELGHIVGWHLWIRNAVLLAPLLILCALGCLTTQPDWSLRWSNFLEQYFWLFAVAGPAAGVTYLTWIVLPAIRHSELQADRYAILDEQGQIASHLCDDYCQALLKLALQHPGSFWRGTVWHPSIRDRLAIVRELARQPAPRQMTAALCPDTTGPC